MITKKTMCKNNITLIIISALLLIGFLIQNIYFNYLCTFVICIFIFSSKIEDALGLSIMLLPLSGIFDDSGFYHLFNIGLMAFSLKLISRTIIKKELTNSILFSSSLVFLLILYDAFNAAINNVLNINYISNFSIWFGYFIIIFMSKYVKTIDPKRIYNYFFWGFAASCVLCLIQVYMKWGLSVPNAYRFVGLLRDPNYFAFTTVILLFSSLYLFKGRIKILYSFITLVFAALSVSKMFLVLLAIGLVLYIIYALYLMMNNKKINIKLLSLIFFVGCLSILFLQFSGLLSLIFDKYLFRFSTFSLTTGRDYIQGEFLNIIFNDIEVAFFGKSLDYNKIYMVTYADSDAMLAHNTYLDLIMSFGLLGSLLYCSILIIIIRLYKKNILVNYKSLILIVIYFATLFVLSYLKADNFSISILFLLITLKKKGKDDNTNEFNSAKAKNVCCNT